MEILFKHTWIMFIGAAILNGIIMKYRSKKYIAQNPELKAGYDKLVKGWVFYSSIPWVIMMIGSLSGITQNTFDYLHPKSMNPMVLIFHLSLVVLWALSVWWIYFWNGAEFIESHPGLFQKSGFGESSNLTARQVKLFFPVMLLAGIIAMIMMWIVDVPTPPF